MEPMGGRIGLHAYFQPSGVKELEIIAGHPKGDECVGNAVADQYPQVANVRQAEKWTAKSWHRAVQRNNSAEFLREREAKPVSQSRPFAEPGQENPFRMNVVNPPCVFDGPQHIVFQLSATGCVRPPAIARLAIESGTQRFGATKGDANVIPPAQVGSNPDDLVLVAAVGVEKNHKRIGIIRLIRGWK